jgi:hypothetical protein
MPILDAESPLLLLPDRLPPDQKRFLEAIRYGIEFVDIAYARLEANLAEVSRDVIRSTHIARTSLILDAWTIVDATHRLRELVKALRNYRNRAPSKQLFLRATSNVPVLRNRIQHLSGDIAVIVEQRLPILGALSWVAVEDREAERFTLCSYHTGGLLAAGGVSPLIQIPDAVNADLEAVTLWAAETTVNLTETRGAVERLARSWESMLRKQCTGEPSTMNDTIAAITVELEAVEPGSTSDGAA